MQQGLSKNSDKSWLICLETKFFSKNFSDFFLYNEDKSISFPLEKTKWYVTVLLFS